MAGDPPNRSGRPRPPPRRRRRTADEVDPGEHALDAEAPTAPHPPPGGGPGATLAVTAPQAGAGAATPAPEAPPNVGPIGRFLPRRVAGRGGMGVVYRALDPTLGREVALKVLGPAADASEEARKRFIREAQATAKLRHPGIVAVHEVGLHEGRPFLVMDWVEGESLHELLARKAPPPRRLAEIVRDVARALHHAHDHGIVHRDVKPHNVMIAADGAARLTDFGIARVADATRMTADGAFMGTPSYMAPEQAGGDSRDHGPATDVYGLGGILYRGLAGRPPFTASDPRELLKKVIIDEPTPPSRLRPSIHAELETIVLRCLEKSPRRRYASADEVAEELARWLEGDPIVARPPGPIERARAGARRHPVRAVAALAGAGLVLVLSATPLVQTWRAGSARRGEAEAKARAAAALLERLAAEQSGGDQPAALLGAGIDALAATTHWRSVDPGSEPARRLAFSAATRFGDAALAAGEWELAEGSFERARATGVDDAEVSAGLERLAEARTRSADARRAEVSAILDAARSGALGESPARFDDAVFALVGRPHPETAAALGEALDAVTTELRDAIEDLLTPAVTPTEDERAAGEGSLPPLPADVVERALRIARGDADRDEDPVSRAIRRVELRSARARDMNMRRFAPGFDSLAAVAQETRAGPSGNLTARLASEALGRLGHPDEAVAPLRRHLAAALDARLASLAAIALLRLGSPEDERLVVAEIARRGGPGAAFARAVRPYLSSDGRKAAVDPDSEAYEARADALRDEGDYLVARDELTAAIDLAPERVTLWVLRADIRRLLGDLDGCSADVDRALGLDADDPWAWLVRGRLLEDRGRLSEALAAFDRAIEEEPENVEPRRGRAELRMRAGDPAGAVEDAERLAAMAPETAEWWTLLGRACLVADDRIRAVEAFQRAVSLDSGDTTARAGLAALGHRVAADPGAPDPALVDADRAVAAAPNLSRPYRARAQLHSDRGDFAKALADLDRALAIDPDDVPGRLLRAQVRIEAGDGTGAVEDLDVIVTRVPDHPHAHAERARALFAAGRFEETIEDLDWIIESRPGLRGWAHCLRADAHRIVGRIPEALADAELAVEMVPGFSSAHRSLGEVLVEVGEHRRALDALEKAIALGEPDSVAVRFARGRARIGLGDREEGEAELVAATELHAGHAGFPQVWRELANVRRANGDVTGARAALERFIATTPDEEARVAAEKELEQLR